MRILSEEEAKQDICLSLIYQETEEGKKVERNKGKKFYVIAEKIMWKIWRLDYCFIFFMSQIPKKINF